MKAILSQLLAYLNLTSSTQTSSPEPLALGACTDFRLTAKDGSILITRSMEFGQDLETAVMTSPRGRVFTTKVPNGKPGISWTTQYGYLFTNGLHIDATIDGMNEEGLSFEYLFFPDEAEYQALPAGQEHLALPYIHLGDWVLGNFKTVAEVQEAISKVWVITQDIPGLGNQFFPLHAAVFDKTGKGIVIEYIKGNLHVHDNHVGVMTNSPAFDWHVTNLRNYLNLSADVPKPIVVNGVTFGVTGQGSGAVGLPGDPSPPSRFVKTSFMLATAFPANNAAELLSLAQHIINNVDIPRGMSRDKVGEHTIYDYTQWVVFKDLTNKKFHYRTYNNMTLRMIDMTKLDFSNGAKRIAMQLADQPYIQDETEKFLTSA